MLQAVLLRKVVVLMIFMLSIALINGQDPSVGSSDAVESCTGDDCTSNRPGETTIAPSTAIPSTAAPTKAPETTMIPTTVRAKQTTRRKIYTTPQPKKCYFEADPDTTFDCAVVKRWIDCIYRNVFGRPEICEFSISSDESQYESSESHFHYVSNHHFHYLFKNHFLIPISFNLPIYYHKDTYETFIMAQSGHIYVMPPLMNFFGQKYSVAQAMVQQYGSLLSNSAPRSSYHNSSPYFYSASQAFNTGSPTTGFGLYFDQKSNRNNGGFSPRFSSYGSNYPSRYY